MKYKIGIFSIALISLNGVIGSSWLLSSMYAARQAGTGAIVAWLIGALLMFVLCLCLCELISLYPESGLLASVCSFSHDKDFSLIIGIANWLGTVAVIPAEAVSTARYLQWPTWTVILLILMYAALNSWGIKIFSKFNSVITLFKFIVPLITMIVLFSYGFNTNNFHTTQLTDWHNIMTAVIAGGIIFGFNGIQMAVNFTGEVKNPKRDIPAALFLSLALALIFYLGLQVAFLGNANPHFNYNSPFVELVAALGMGWLVILLKADAAISPSGCGFSYIASTTRMLTAMSRERQFPKFFNVLHPKYGISYRSLITNTILSILLFGIFKSWARLILVVSTFHVISYLAGPLAVGRLRKTMPDADRSFTLPIHWIICPILFVILSLLFVLSGFSNTMGITFICLVIQAIYVVLNYKGKALFNAAKRSAFLPIWLVVLTLSAYYKVDFSIVAVISLFMYYLGIRR